MASLAASALALSLTALLITLVLLPPVVAATPAPSDSTRNVSTTARDLWVVLVGTSRNWLNYRDNSNTIALYRMFRKLGVPDSRIILMLGHSMACDPRNPHPGHLFVNPDHSWDLYSEDIEVDYRGADVTVENFLRMLSGLHPSGTPLSKQLRSSENSDVLVYLTGHGGDKFLKFQDKEELQANDLADALHHMYLQRRYRTMLLMSDTCQADSLHSQLRSPGILAIASSAKGENSYSYLPDTDLGVTVVDRFTYTTLQFIEEALHPGALGTPGQHSLAGLFKAYDPAFLMSTPCLRSDLYPYPLDEIPALQYFVSPSDDSLSLMKASPDSSKRMNAIPPGQALASGAAAKPEEGPASRAGESAVGREELKVEPGLAAEGRTLEEACSLLDDQGFGPGSWSDAEQGHAPGADSWRWPLSVQERDRWIVSLLASWMGLLVVASFLTSQV